MKRGLFITFEGPDGSGKSTQIKLMEEYLKASGHDTLLTREPGGTEISEKIRQIILDTNNTEMSHMTEALLYAASRAQHVDQVIRPALEAGKTVICDRFVDSSIVYQGFGRKLGESVEVINEYAIGDCMPDITILLMINPSIGISRASDGKPDRIESESISYHEAVYEAYLALMKKFPERIFGVDASGTIESIHEEIRNKINELLK